MDDNTVSLPNLKSTLKWYSIIAINYYLLLLLITTSVSLAVFYIIKGR